MGKKLLYDAYIIFGGCCCALISLLLTNWILETKSLGAFIITSLLVYLGPVILLAAVPTLIGYATDRRVITAKRVFIRSVWLQGGIALAVYFIIWGLIALNNFA